MKRPDRNKWDAVGYSIAGETQHVVFKCRCCGATKDFGITKEEWLSDPDAEEPEPKVEIR